LHIKAYYMVNFAIFALLMTRAFGEHHIANKRYSNKYEFSNLTRQAI
jgi:hypothetical protein